MSYYGASPSFGVSVSPIRVSAVPDSASAIGFEETWAPGVDSPTNGAIEEAIDRLLANGTTKRYVRKVYWTGGRPITQFFDNNGTSILEIDHHPTSPSMTFIPSGGTVDINSTAGTQPLALRGSPLRLGGNIELPNDIAPTALNGTVNDYSPTGLSTAAVIRQDASGASVITGLAGGADGRVILLLNISAASSITLNTADAGSAAANQFLLKANLAIAAKGGALLYYDSTATKWRAVAVY